MAEPRAEQEKDQAGDTFKLACATQGRSRFVGIGIAKDGTVKVRYLDDLRSSVPPDEDWVQYLRLNLPELMAGFHVGRWWLYECAPVLIAEGEGKEPRSG